MYQGTYICDGTLGWLKLCQRFTSGFCLNRPRRSCELVILVEHRWEQVHVRDGEDTVSFWDMFLLLIQPPLVLETTGPTLFREKSFLSPWSCVCQVVLVSLPVHPSCCDYSACSMGSSRSFYSFPSMSICFWEACQEPESISRGKISSVLSLLPSLRGEDTAYMACNMQKEIKREISPLAHC